MQIKAHARYESIILANARVATSGRPAIVIVRDNTADKGIYLKMKGGTSELSATGEAAAVQMDRSVELYVSLAEGGVSSTSALAISNTGDDITVDFTADWGYKITSGGNVAYRAIHEEQTVAAPTVQKAETPAWPDP